MCILRQVAFASWFTIVVICFASGLEAVELPDCQVQAPSQKTLDKVRTVRIPVPAPPFGVVSALHQNVAFVSLDSTLGVLNTTNFTPSLLRQISLPRSYYLSAIENGFEGAAGLSLTHDGKYVLVALGTAAVVVDVAKAVKASGGAVVGALNGTAGSYATEITITRDDEYVFVSQEYGEGPMGNDGSIEVFRLHKPNAKGRVSGTYVGNLRLGQAVVGMALSPDGSILYATSEYVGSNLNATRGSLSVIDVGILKKDPANARISVVRAGCGPVRAIVTSDGKIVWVTARESNHLLAFDAAKLISNKSEALLASVQVGTSPVGLILTKDDTRILTADSNRFGDANAASGLSVVDVSRALRGESAVLGRIPTGVFPREFALSYDKSTILVSDHGTMFGNLTRVQAIKVATIP